MSVRGLYYVHLIMRGQMKWFLGVQIMPSTPSTLKKEIYQKYYILRLMAMKSKFLTLILNSNLN